MNRCVKTFLIVCLPFFVYSQSIERQVITTSAGSFVQTSTASLSYSVGEPIIVTGSSNTSFLLQGFQQPSPLIRTSIYVIGDSDPCKVSIFPNPTTQSLLFKENVARMSFEIFDATGKSMGIYKITNGQIDVTLLPTGIYFLQSECENHVRHTQKFIKQ
ncbi:MAG: T9SS type A sorting domain-containing protein [Saprospiraceae bacterium]|nr:T9SS type A sorting domain-containing protein [Saprospiraceae bacterium]